MLRASAVVRADEAGVAPIASIRLDAQDRHVRRKRLVLDTGVEVLVDLPLAVRLHEGDCLVLDSGGLLQVQAAVEPLMEVTAETPALLLQVAWHIGNRHTDAQIEAHRILLRRDHVMAQMLAGLGARTREVDEPFSPAHGAYHAHGQTHGHTHGQTHGHGGSGHDH